METAERLLVLYTGGTIGMGMTAQGLAPWAGFTDLLAQQLERTARSHALVAADVHCLGTPIDSAEASQLQWAAMADYLAQHWQRYRGFVILHGTDTLAYAASALSFMLRELDRPVVLTGAQRPLQMAGSDAAANLQAAQTFASRGTALPEVGLAFHGRLLRGNRSTKATTTDDFGFDSPQVPPLAWMQPQDQDCLPALPAGSAVPLLELPQPGRGGHVQVLYWTPGLTERALQACLDAQPAAIVLLCYGAGTVAELAGATRRFLERAQRQGVVVVTVSQVRHGGVHIGNYAAGALLRDLDVVDGRDMGVEAACTKLQHLAGLGWSAPAIREAMGRSLAGEISAV